MQGDDQASRVFGLPFPFPPRPNATNPRLVCVPMIVCVPKNATNATVCPPVNGTNATNATLCVPVNATNATVCPPVNATNGTDGTNATAGFINGTNATGNATAAGNATMEMNCTNVTDPEYVLPFAEGTGRPGFESLELILANDTVWGIGMIKILSFNVLNPLAAQGSPEVSVSAVSRYGDIAPVGMAKDHDAHPVRMALYVIEPAYTRSVADQSQPFPCSWNTIVVGLQTNVHMLSRTGAKVTLAGFVSAILTEQDGDTEVSSLTLSLTHSLTHSLTLSLSLSFNSLTHFLTLSQSQANVELLDASGGEYHDEKFAMRQVLPGTPHPEPCTLHPAP